jgi:RNA polymerase primary sigma factor
LPTRQGQATLKLLLEKAGVQGYLTTDDLMEAAPEAEPGQLRTLLKLVAARGIELLDEDESSGALADENSPEPETAYFEPPAGDPASGEDTVGIYLKEMSRVPLLNRLVEL